MSKKKSIMVATISFVVVIALGGILGGSYYFYKTSSYNKIIRNANNYFNSGEYDKAIEAFEQALVYKQDSDVQNKITLANNLKKAEKYYKSGIANIEKGNYGEAISDFSNIEKDGGKIYEEAQQKIAQCKNELIGKYITKAKALAEQGNYEESNNQIEEILKLDENNEEAKTLKESNITAANKKAEEEKQKELAKQEAAKLAEEKAKKEAEAKAKEAEKKILTVDEAKALLIKSWNVDTNEEGVAYFADMDKTLNGVRYYFFNVVSLDGEGGASACFINSSNGKIISELSDEYNTLMN